MREKREANANATWRALIRDRPRGDGVKGDWNWRTIWRGNQIARWWRNKGTETDVLYGVAIDRAVMAYKGTETDVLYGVEMAWRADATAHALLTRGFTF
jgi:hypothetical protein